MSTIVIFIISLLNINSNNNSGAQAQIPEEITLEELWEELKDKRNEFLLNSWYGDTALVYRVLDSIPRRESINAGLYKAVNRITRDYGKYQLNERLLFLGPMGDPDNPLYQPFYKITGLEKPKSILNSDGNFKEFLEDKELQEYCARINMAYNIWFIRYILKVKVTEERLHQGWFGIGYIK